MYIYPSSLYEPSHALSACDDSVRSCYYKILSMITKKIIPILTTIFALAAVLIVPGSTFAKNNNIEADAQMKGHTNIEISTSSHPCLHAFGHFIALGWLTKHDTPTLAEGCHLPQGIFNLFHRGGNGHGNGTTTDMTAPIISTIDVTTATTSAKITWSTNERADSNVFYGTSSPIDVNDSNTLKESGGSLVFNHSIMVDDLEASTTYYAIIQSHDASGNTATSSQFSFTTGNSDDISAPLITNLGTNIGTSTIVVNWDTNEIANSKVYYGTSTPLNLGSAGVVSNGAFTLDHSLTIPGLSASTTYHLVAESTDMAGNIRTSGEFSATTSAAL